MNRPPPPFTPLPTVPGWVLVAGAALAACLATSVPGLVLLLEGNYQSYPDVLALIPELFVAGVASAFGAVQLRAQLLGRGRLGGGLLVAANLALVFVIGVVFDFKLMAGGTLGGLAFIIGLAVVLAVVAVNALVAGGTWWLLAALAKRVTTDLAAPEGATVARVRVATWLLGAAALHVVVKGVGGGPVVIGMLVAVVAAGLLLTAQGSGRRGALVAGAAGIIVVGLVATAVPRLRDMKRQQIEKIALCTELTDPTIPGGGVREHDTLARATRRVTGVADAASDVTTLPNGKFQVAVYVLPTKGGPLAPELASAVEAAIAGVKCTEARDGARPTIVVQGARYVPVTLHVSAVVNPGADEARVRAIVNRAVHETFDLDVALPPGALPRELVTSHVRQGRLSPSAGDASIVFVQYRVGEIWLETYIGQLAPGSVVVVEKIDIDVTPQHD